MIIPGKENSKNVKLISAYVFKESETNKFVLEPIRVVIPPKIATKLSGIKNLLKELSVSRIIPCNIGIKIITTGVL